jgi:MFS transporter, AAHS family, 4-hydroxybenzoate transporter
MADIAAAQPCSSRDDLSKANIVTLVLCFATILLDGVDTSSIGVAGPAIARDLNVPASALTPAFVMTGIGAAAGYLSCSYFTRIWGARRVIASSVVLFGCLSLLTPFATSIAALAAMRFLTAVGLGAALPAAIVLAVDIAPSRLRESVTIVVGTGLALGGVMAGLVGGAAVARFGWQSLFYAGGVLPLLLAPMLWCWLPQPPTREAAGESAVVAAPRDQTYSTTVKGLFSRGLGRQTALLWMFSFLIFSDAYAIAFWIPALLIEFGFSVENAPFGVAVFSIGGVVANVLLVPLVSRFTARDVLSAAGVFAALCIGCIATRAIPASVLLVAIAGAGGGLIACSIGQSALAVSLYPQDLRTAGVGYSAAAGRFGSIFGPAAFGALFSMRWRPEAIAIAAIVPVFLAFVVLLFLGILHRRRAVAISVQDR